MITGTNERVVTIYTINDNTYTDYGYNIPQAILPYDYDFYDDYVETVPEIIEELYSKFTGCYEHKIKIKLIYSRDYFGEYDMDFEYEILESKETDYWEDIND